MILNIIKNINKILRIYGTLRGTNSLQRMFTAGDVITTQSEDTVTGVRF